jgi:hypothetical protein
MLLKTVDRNKAKQKERTVYRLRAMDYVQSTQFQNHSTRPATELVLRSLVSTFFNLVPAWMDANSAPRSWGPPPPKAGGGPAAGGGGGGGAPPGGGGGGGGGAAAPGGGGGGGGGGAEGAVTGVSLSGEKGVSSTGGAGGGGGGTVGLLSCTGVADFDSSIALKGLGGAIVPKRILASCLALPPPTRSSSSSSDDSLSDPAADQSSSCSGRARGLRSRGPGMAAGPDATFVLASCCCCWSLKNGFVDCPSEEGVIAAGSAKGGEMAAAAWASVGWLSCRKNGFFDSAAPTLRLLEGEPLTAGVGWTSAASAGVTDTGGGENTGAAGVLISTGPSSSEELSSRFSSSRCS